MNININISNGKNHLRLHKYFNRLGTTFKKRIENFAQELSERAIRAEKEREELEKEMSNPQ